MTLPTCSLLVLGKNQQELQGFQLRHVLGVADELILLANDSARFGGLGAIGNSVIERSRCDVVGIVHADTVLGAGILESLRNASSRGAVTGIVGALTSSGNVWCRDIQTETSVSTLDSCAVFMPRTLGLRFDAGAFDSFHCCVEDLCLQAHQRSTPVLVVPGPADHLGTNWGKPDWMSEYWAYRAKLSQKWAGVEFRTT